MKNKTITIGISIMALVCLNSINSLAQKSHPELGTVDWLRNYDHALDLAKKLNKNILILFQEVPGCSTCVDYGQNVLSNPLLVEAIENEFIPLAIFNNKGGMDKKILQKYNEPSWNNPVVRIVDAQGVDVLERNAGKYSETELVSYIIKSIKLSDADPPLYLSLLHDQLVAKSRRLTKDYYEMYCFWSGEAHLGQLEGVIATAPGFMNGAEVVEVIYDDEKLNKKDLDQHAAKAKCQHVDKPSKFKIDKDPQYYLKNSEYRYIPLNNIQKTKINTALSNQKDARIYLSPKQLEWLSADIGRDTKIKNLYHETFKEAWKKLDK